MKNQLTSYHLSMTDRTEVRDCSIARSLQLVGEKWSLLVVRELLLGNTRFEQIRRYTGAPRDILTVRLRKLEEAGLIVRVRYQERPARFEYRLTGLGRSLDPVLSALSAWGDEHLPAPGGAGARRDSRTDAEGSELAVVDAQ